MEIAETCLGVAAWQLLAGQPYERIDVASRRLSVPRGGELVAWISRELELNFPRRFSLYFRVDFQILEMPLVQVKSFKAPPCYPADADAFPMVPVQVEFFSMHGRSPVWHYWPDPLPTFVALRTIVPTPANERDVDRVRRRLMRLASGIPDGPVEFDSEGGWRVRD
jgi:hypothetical protein